MQNKNIKTLLILMIVLSLFSGISINGNWGFTSKFELIDFPKMLIFYGIEFREFSGWIIILLSHIGILSLPFFLKNKHFKKMLLYSPLTFLIGYLMCRPEYLFLLVPFICLWLIALNKLNHNKLT